jgi:hypothetical protein
LKTNAEIIRILTIYNGTNSIESVYDTNTVYRYNEAYIVKNGKLEPTGKKKDPPPYNVTVGKGSVYGVFSRAFVNYSINDVIARGILKWLEDTYSPDESFWATLVLNKHISIPGVSYSGGYKQNLHSGTVKIAVITYIVSTEFTYRYSRFF